MIKGVKGIARRLLKALSVTNGECIYVMHDFDYVPISSRAELRRLAESVTAMPVLVTARKKKAGKK